MTLIAEQRPQAIVRGAVGKVGKGPLRAAHGACTCCLCVLARAAAGAGAGWLRCFAAVPDAR